MLIGAPVNTNRARKLSLGDVLEGHRRVRNQTPGECCADFRLGFFRNHFTGKNGLGRSFLQDSERLLQWRRVLDVGVRVLELNNLDDPSDHTTERPDETYLGKLLSFFFSIHGVELGLCSLL